MQLVKKNPKPLNVGSQQVRALIVLREDKIKTSFGAWRSVIGIHHRACNSCERPTDRTKEKMAAKAFFFLLIAVTVAILPSDALYLKRTFYSDSK